MYPKTLFPLRLLLIVGVSGGVNKVKGLTDRKKTTWLEQHYQ